MPMFSGSEISKSQGSELCPYKAKGGMADGCRHLPHLAISPLRESNLQPRCRDALPESYGCFSSWQSWVFLQEPDFRISCFSPLDHHTRSQFVDSLSARDLFYLSEIGSLVPITRVEQSMLELVVVREKEKSLAIRIEPADRVDVGRKRPQVAERLPA